ncbi:MAG: hypothetical protein C0459_04070 [Chitinophaga sp.]|jgi:hypothetical protein|nr:hypothetical protein [Chitinophaga sp.]
MRKIFFYNCLIILSFKTYSQDIAAVGMQSEFKAVTGFGTRQTGFEGFQTYSSNKIIGSQFFFPTWSKGFVITYNKELVKNDDYLYVFDKVRQLIFLKQKDSSSILLANKHQISSFTLTNTTQHVFENSNNFNFATKDIFFEVLIKDSSKYTLLKEIKTTFIRADLHDIVKVKSGENYDEFKDEFEYYISYKNNIPQKLTLNERKLKKIIDNPAKNNLIDESCSQSIKFESKEAFYIDFVTKLNK